ncbi:CDP-alcohol phosphatidyltransferase family protein [Salisaeta longa]|uniref:CDP-alcohol phosphatidyltransferase family protein n=1 Tax=Salisaeta longa TaxID=503170 RepID=UPI0003B63032|nr:CDP-alcohol phosphatidyltransferase family protein [Salisaeta longa]
MALAVRRFLSASPIERWSLVNALGLLVATGLTLSSASMAPVALVGIGLLAGLGGVAREDWTPSGRWGWANAVTAARAAAVAVLPLVPPTGIAAIGLVILCTDGLDGWLARRQGEASTFGAFLDKETDAFFLLMLCLLAARAQVLPAGVVAAGLLRYVFVLALFWLQPEAPTEQRSSAARYVFVAAVLGLLLPFVAPQALAVPVALLALAALGLSFARSFWWIFRFRTA